MLDVCGTWRISTLNLPFLVVSAEFQLYRTLIWEMLHFLEHLNSNLMLFQWWRPPGNQAHFVLCWMAAAAVAAWSGRDECVRWLLKARLRMTVPVHSFLLLFPLCLYLYVDTSFGFLNIMIFFTLMSMLLILCILKISFLNKIYSDSGFHALKSSQILPTHQIFLFLSLPPKDIVI